PAGCAGLIIRHEDNVGKTTGKVLARILLGAGTIGISEFKMAEHRIIVSFRQTRVTRRTAV
ncbi:MAG: hypothetical protein L6437_16135, partial [Kiritimatiellae bacterium]|nr:hypothetical protein [Kiritimatiellia bacterium]